MNFLSILVLAISLSFTAIVSAHGDEHDEEAEHQHEEAAKGPHGGRLLSQDDFALEVTIYETEVEPELRLYLYQNGEPIKTSELKLQVTLQRLGEPAELIHFSPELDYWLGDTVIREPHSFEVEISASYQGKNFEWHYDSFEGRTELSARSVEKAGIELEQTQAGQIQTQLHLFGVVAPVPEQQYQVGAAYAGVVQQLAVKVGDKVTKGQLVATVQNPVSLKNYSVFAPAAGEVTAKYVSVGAKVSEQPIVEISDFSSVYIEMSAFPSDTEQLKLGQEFLVKDLHGHQSAVSQISYIAGYQYCLVAVVYIQYVAASRYIGISLEIGVAQIVNQCTYATRYYINCRGIRSSGEMILDCTNQLQPDILILTETKLSSPNYRHFRRTINKDEVIGIAQRPQGVVSGRACRLLGAVSVGHVP